MTTTISKEQCLNIADQCTATATSDLAASILVDGGNGTLRQLLNDAADAIRAGWVTPSVPQQEDAARYQWLADYLIGDRTDLDNAILACASERELSEVIDADLKQGDKV